MNIFHKKINENVKILDRIVPGKNGSLLRGTNLAASTGTLIHFHSDEC